jgi:mono/diheme cytochrome c family protein
MHQRVLSLAILGALTSFAVPAFAQAPGSVERGVKVYAEQRCSLCHAVAGKGNPKGPLDDVATKLSAADIRLWLEKPEEMRLKTKSERRPPMKSFVTLAKDDMDGLLAYLQTLKKK